MSDSDEDPQLQLRDLELDEDDMKLEAIDERPNWFETPDHLNLPVVDKHFHKQELWQHSEEKVPFFDEGKTGPRNMPDGVENFTILQIFLLLFPLSTLEAIVVQTNLYYAQCCVRDKEPIQASKFLQLKELMWWLGLHMKFTKEWCGAQDAYFEDGSAFDARRVMPRHRFYWIKKYLHFSDNSKEPPRSSPLYDQLYKLRLLIETLNMTFGKYWKAYTYVSLDEMMLAFKGKNPFHRYIPRKPHPNGTKLHAICCSVSYWCMRFMVDDNITRSVPEIAYYLFKNHVDPGQIIVTDRWYSCQGLVALCLLLGIGLLATTTTNCFLGKRSLTGWSKQEGKAKERGEYECAVNQDQTVCCLCWKDGSVVRLTMTAGCTARTRITRNKRNMGKFLVKAPMAIQNFFQWFHGCDRSDQMRGPGYGTVGTFRASKYTVKFFLGCFDMVLANAWILWTTLHPLYKKKKMHRHWWLDLANQMMNYDRPVDFDAPPVTGTAHDQRKFGMDAKGKRRRHYLCTPCAVKNTRKRTVTGCQECMVALCSPICSNEWHQWSVEERKRNKKRHHNLTFEDD